MKQLREEEGNPPFGGSRQSDIESDVEQAFVKLVPIRHIYEPDVLQELAKLLPRHIAIENQAVLLEQGPDENFIVGMPDATNAVSLRNIVRALKIPFHKLIPRFIDPPRLAMLQQTAYEAREDALALRDHESDHHQGPAPTRDTISWSTLDSATSSAVKEKELSEPEMSTGGDTMTGGSVGIVSSGFAGGFAEIYKDGMPLAEKIYFGYVPQSQQMPFGEIIIPAAFIPNPGCGRIDVKFIGVGSASIGLFSSTQSAPVELFDTRTGYLRPDPFGGTTFNFVNAWTETAWQSP